MEQLTDRLVAWALRLVATMMLFAGASVFVAAVPVLGMLAESPVARTIGGFLFQLGGVFVVAGAAARRLSRPRGRLLPNERLATSDAARPGIGGWLIAMAACLVALPVWLVIRLQPFLAEWAQVIELLAASGMWEGANANGSGLVLLPLAAALTPPLFELSAMVGFLVASVSLLILLLSRSRRFPRLYLVCIVLLSALVIASVRGADAAMLAGDAVQQFIDSTSQGPEESAELQGILTRYTSIVASTAPVLAWTLCGYLIWVPAMIFSRRARTTFANGLGGRGQASASAPDIEAITNPPRFPG